MSRPHFLADEDLRGSIVRAVRRLAPLIEISTVVEDGYSSATDQDVLALAWQRQRLLVSHDVNTMKSFAERRIADGEGIHGLLLVPQHHAVPSIVESLVLIWEASEFEEWRDRIVYLPL
jgi:hypothetical protein